MAASCIVTASWAQLAEPGVEAAPGEHHGGNRSFTSRRLGSRGLLRLSRPGVVRSISSCRARCGSRLEGSVDPGVVRAVLKSLRLVIGLPAGTRIWIAAGVTDMRRGFHGLSAQVQTVLEQQPLSGHVFVFRGRRGDIVKVLWFDGDGLMSAGQAARTWTLCMAPGDQWYGISKPCSALDAARRDRLESTAPDGRTGDECLSVSLLYLCGFYAVTRTAIHGILRTCLLLHFRTLSRLMLKR